MQTQLLIGGRLKMGQGPPANIVDPATGASIAAVAQASPEQVVEMGPLISSSHRDRVAGFVERAAAAPHALLDDQ